MELGQILDGHLDCYRLERRDALASAFKLDVTTGKVDAELFLNREGVCWSRELR